MKSDIKTSVHVHYVKFEGCANFLSLHSICLLFSGLTLFTPLHSSSLILQGDLPDELFSQLQQRDGLYVGFPELFRDDLENSWKILI